MQGGLSTVDYGQGVHRLSLGYKLRCRSDTAESIGDMGKGQNGRVWGKFICGIVKIDVAIIINGDDFELRASVGPSVAGTMLEWCSNSVMTMS